MLIARLLGQVRFIAAAVIAFSPYWAQAEPTLALYYGAQPAVAELQAFDLVVLEPEHVAKPSVLPRTHTQWFAYVSVVETQASRPYAADMPSTWRRGQNTTWQSLLIDQTAPGWAEFFEQRVIAPLWARGWRGFFLDTLDSYRLFATTPEAALAQQTALASLLSRLPARFPGIQLIFNRGFELLPLMSERTHIAGVAAESLVGGYDHGSGQYRTVSAADRTWLLNALLSVRNQFKLPVFAIDYAAPDEPQRRREIAAEVRALGITPYVTDALLNTIGVGRVEVVPRRIALLADRPTGADWMNASAYQWLSLPLNYLGYTVEPFDLADPLPDLSSGRYAAVVTWFTQPPAQLQPQIASWLVKQQKAGLKLILMNRTPFFGGSIRAENDALRALGMRRASINAGAVQLDATHPSLDFEATAPKRVNSFEAVQFVESNRNKNHDRLPVAWLSGKSDAALNTGGASAAPSSATNNAFVAVGVTAWGGFAFDPFVMRSVRPDTDIGTRWLLDPIEFLSAALGQPGHPIPDVSTEGGRRLLMVHIDGDGFASRAEAPGSPFAPELLYREVLARYKLPTTMSVIQAEVSKDGLFKDHAPQLEAIARRMFALPYVEVASHSYSHPFNWQTASNSSTKRSENAAASSLSLPGYQFDLRTEINGSASYIDQQLAPTDKRTRLFLWTGDCRPAEPALALAAEAGLLNMNGGDTLITRDTPTLTAVSGLGLRRGSYLQVFAPMQNENVYTNLWTGPFYGYQRAIETFELTDKPRRLKPINIYFHTYSASKQAGLNALHKVYRYALEQPTTAIFASDYVRKVLDFDELSIARDLTVAGDSTADAQAPQPPQPTRWQIRGQGALRTLRVPAKTDVALATSHHVAGSVVNNDVRYLHLTAPAASVDLTTAKQITSVAPQVIEASGWLSDLRQNTQGGVESFTLSSYRNASFVLSQATHCRVFNGSTELKPHAVNSGTSGHLRYDLPIFEPATTAARFVVELRCR